MIGWTLGPTEECPATALVVDPDLELGNFAWHRSSCADSTYFGQEATRGPSEALLPVRAQLVGGLKGFAGTSTTPRELRRNMMILSSELRKGT